MTVIVMIFVFAYALDRITSRLSHKCEGRDCIVCRVEAMYP